MTDDATQVSSPGPTLPGQGENDYERYMRIPELLSLQRGHDERHHRDELLFQVVHQSTELWLHLAIADTTEATKRVRSGELMDAAELLTRAALAVQLITEQLAMVERLPPAVFEAIRPSLGNGSGFESPGWTGLRRAARQVWHAFSALLAERSTTPEDLYWGTPDRALHQLAEKLTDLDESMTLWRARHYVAASRVRGDHAMGIRGASVSTLASLVQQRQFPQLWAARGDPAGLNGDP